MVEVQERIAADGNVVIPLDEVSLEAALDVLERHEVRSIAICLINACTNPAHELAIAERVRGRFPRTLQ